MVVRREGPGPSLLRSSLSWLACAACERRPHGGGPADGPRSNASARSYPRSYWCRRVWAGVAWGAIVGGEGQPILPLAEAGVPRREDSVVALIRCRTRAYVARFLADRLVDLEGLANVNDVGVSPAVDYPRDTLPRETEVARQVADGLPGGMMAAQKDDQVRWYTRSTSLCQYTVAFLSTICKTIVGLVYPIVAGGANVERDRGKTSEYYIKRTTKLSALHAPSPVGRVLARFVSFIFSPALGRGAPPWSSSTRGAASEAVRPT